MASWDLQDSVQVVYNPIMKLQIKDIKLIYKRKDMIVILIITQNQIKIFLNVHLLSVAISLVRSYPSS